MEWLDFFRSQEFAWWGMKAAPKQKVRCAIYTRKSSEEGLEQEFNSLDAQREACEAYIASQKGEGWQFVLNRYDDGGISGGTLERPALKRLLRDIEEGLVNVVVVYKIDRLSRSLMDFTRLVDIFDRNEVTFVSITQSFNTTTSMGKLTLNILLSFAQFEREVIGERIRDKIAASRRRGMWMGGVVPYGYVAVDRKLRIQDAEADVVRRLFRRFVALGSATKLAQELLNEGATTRSGKPLDKGVIYKWLNNPVYLGQAVHKGEAYKGEHAPIIEQKLWDNVQSIMRVSPRERAAKTRAQTPALLKGLIFGPGGVAMSPTHTRRRQKLYRYYTSQAVLKKGAGACEVARLQAGQIEAAVLDKLRDLIRSPEIIVATFRQLRSQGMNVRESDIRLALQQLDPLWDQLLDGEKARIVQLLVARVDVAPNELKIHLRTEGIGNVVRDFGQKQLPLAKP